MADTHVIPFYDVYRSSKDGFDTAHLFRGPLSSVVAILGLQREAERRVITECAERGGICQMHNDEGSAFRLKNSTGEWGHNDEVFVIQRAAGVMGDSKTIDS